MSVEVTKLLKILSEANLDSLVVVDMSGKRVNPKQIPPALTVTITNTPMHEKGIIQDDLNVGTVERNAMLNKEDTTLLETLSSNYEDINWRIEDCDQETKDMLNFDCYLLSGVRNGEMKSFVIPTQMKMKEKLQWGNAIGHDLYEGELNG